MPLPPLLDAFPADLTAHPRPFQLADEKGGAAYVAFFTAPDHKTMTLQSFRALFHNSTFGVALFDADGIIKVCKKKWRSCLCSRAAETIYVRIVGHLAGVYHVFKAGGFVYGLQCCGNLEFVHIAHP